MKHWLLLSLVTLTFACRENPAPESQAVTTASTETTSSVETTTTAPETSAPPTVEGPKLQPADEGTTDPSFVTYRAQLIDAVKRRDAEAVLTLSDPKIRTSFGGGGGSADLRKMLSQPGMWEDFEQLLGMGGAFRGEGEGRSFWAPYVYSNWPETEDAFESFAVTGANVPLYESQDTASAVVATLAHDLVRRAAPGRDEGPWRHVKTADGKTGYVEARNVRSPIGYRAGFMRGVEGQWRMNALVAGD